MPSEFPVTITNAAVDGSGTITTGGSAQQLFATVGHGCYVANPDTTRSLWLSLTGTAAPNAGGSFELPAGAYYETPVGCKPAGAVSIYGATTGQPFTAGRW